jgi:hypothetical protein
MGEDQVRRISHFCGYQICEGTDMDRGQFLLPPWSSQSTNLLWLQSVSLKQRGSLWADDGIAITGLISIKKYLCFKMHSFLDLGD